MRENLGRRNCSASDSKRKYCEGCQVDRTLVTTCRVGPQVLPERLSLG